MADLKYIADNDPGGSLDQALNTMLTEKVDSDEKVLITDSSLAREVGLTVTIDVMNGIESAIGAGDLPARVMKWIENEGVDINFQDTKDMLLMLVSKNHITDDQRLSILSVGQRPKYVGLTLQTLDKARRLRAEGKV